MVSPEKERDLLRQMEQLKVKENDLREKFIRGSGPGGQKINKTSSCVYIRHIPSGIEVKCGRSRSQALNRFLARRELCERLAGEIFKRKTQKQQEIAKIRRQKRRRSQRQKEKMLSDKRRRAETKAKRKAVDIDK